MSDRDAVLRRIRGLLARAELTELEAEAEALVEEHSVSEQEARERGAGPYRPYNAIDVISRAEPSDGIGLGGRVVKGRPKKAPDGRL